MSRRHTVWLGLVFGLCLLAELPAVWLARGLGVPAEGVVGSLWQGQATRLGPVGHLRWELSPWRLQAQAWLDFQGQGWQVSLAGWPWRWQGELVALGARPAFDQGYRLVGLWQGSLRVTGSGGYCRQSEGRLVVEDLALVEPWSLGLGRGVLEMNCPVGWQLVGELGLAQQHQMRLDVDLVGRRARLDLQVQPEAALTPVLRGAQWLGEQALEGQREIRW
ncbi:MAG: type II secretion system protein N [Paucimonas sp.]|jgi:general secretion pathway protein N|uniref:type II secretion system protein N n=1 Tax=Pantoea sp. Cy-639 TaxID=2608360 RepID=UPI001421A0DE|nr:type II secretion system protein N [Pantoea sp. Cy-639]MDR2307269.1 type II secretion system protein N [Paucimonas sp.]NIF16239.1 type II secretion system protein N [Pantoea sp. Cy-639]